MGHRTALSTVEEFGLIDALHPGRLDLGLGRSGGRPPGGAGGPGGNGGAGSPPTPKSSLEAIVSPAARAARSGLLIPAKFDLRRLLGSPRIAMQKGLLQLPGARSQDYGEQVSDVLALLRGTYRSPDGRSEEHTSELQSPC